MKILKFGGTSVANASTISLVKEIVSNTESDKVVVIVSAFGGITDLLLNTAKLAANYDDSYSSILNEIEKRHLSTIKELIPINSQSKVLSKVKSELNALETLLEGAYMIGEITPKLSDKIVSYGELLSSYIIAEYFKAERLDVSHKDSRELIKTFDGNGRSTVDFDTTKRTLQGIPFERPECYSYYARFYSFIQKRGSLLPWEGEVQIIPRQLLQLPLKRKSLKYGPM